MKVIVLGLNRTGTMCMYFLPSFLPFLFSSLIFLTQTLSYSSRQLTDNVYECVCINSNVHGAQTAGIPSVSRHQHVGKPKEIPRPLDRGYEGQVHG